MASVISRFITLSLQVSLLIAVGVLTALPRAAADEVPQSFTLDGRLFSDPQSTTPLEDASIGFKVQVLDEAEACVLYEEQQSVNTVTSKGYFSVRVGSAIGNPRRTLDDSANSMATVFQNITSVSGKLLSDSTACVVPPTVGKRRYVRISISPSTMGGTARVLLPSLTIDSVPNAIVAERAESVQGFRGADLLKVNTSAGSALTQSNLESLFTSVSRFNSLSAVVDGTSSNYVQTSANGARLPVIAGAPATPTQGSIWFDTGDNRLKFFDGSAPVTLSTGSGLTGTGTTNVIPRFTSATAIGDSALTDNGTTVISSRSISVATGQNFRINGSRVLGVHDTNSVAVGPGANNSSAAGQNTAVGFNAHNANGTGNDNTAVGYSAASAILSGSHRNTAVGSSALANNTTGGSDNTAIGFYAGPRDGTGAVSSTVYIGSEAGRNTNTGNLNTFIGTRAGTTTLGTTLFNSTAIGYNASVDANNSLVLGSSTVNVGIAGVTSPTSRLDFEGAVTVRGIPTHGLSNAGQGRIYFSSADNKFKVSENGGAFVDLVGGGGGGSGTVTSVTGTLPILVATGTTTPVVSIASANTTTTGALTSTDWNLFNAKLASPLTTKGDLLSRDGTAHVRIPVGVNGQVLVPDSGEAAGLKWTNFSIENLKTAGGTAQFASASCDATQTLTWSSLTNTFTCSTIAGLAAGAMTSGTIDDARLPPSAKYWAAATGGINYAGGNVGVGTATPAAKLEIVGAAVSRANIIATGNAVDLSLSNVHVLRSVGDTTIALSNMTTGGSYTLIVSDAAQVTYAFTGCTNTYFSPTNGQTFQRSTYSILTIIDAGVTDCYVSWVTGFSG